MSRDPQRLADYLAHIAEAIERIGRYTGNIDESTVRLLARIRAAQAGMSLR